MTTIPPVDSGDDLDEANKARKACVRWLEKLPDDWRQWVLASLLKQFEVKPAVCPQTGK